MSDELRAILLRLPNKRAAARAFADHRDKTPDPAWRDLWALLAAEVADLDDAERAAFREWEAGIAWPLPRQGEPG